MLNCLGLLQTQLKPALRPAPWQCLQLQLAGLPPTPRGLDCRVMVRLYQMLLALIPLAAQTRLCMDRPAPAAPAELRRTGWLWGFAIETEAVAEELFALLSGATGPLGQQAAAWCATASLGCLIALAMEGGGDAAQLLELHGGVKSMTKC